MVLIKPGLMGTPDVFQLDNEKQHVITQLLGVAGLYPWKFSRNYSNCTNHLNYYIAVSSDKWCMQIHAYINKQCIYNATVNTITSSGN